MIWDYDSIGGRFGNGIKKDHPYQDDPFLMLFYVFGGYSANTAVPATRRRRPAVMTMKVVAAEPVTGWGAGVAAGVGEAEVVAMGVAVPGRGEGVGEAVPGMGVAEPVLGVGVASDRGVAVGVVVGVGVGLAVGVPSATVTVTGEVLIRTLVVSLEAPISVVGAKSTVLEPPLNVLKVTEASVPAPFFGVPPGRIKTV